MDSNDGLALTRRQAFIWANYGQFIDANVRHSDPVSLMVQQHKMLSMANAGRWHDSQPSMFMDTIDGKRMIIY